MLLRLSYSILPLICLFLSLCCAFESFSLLSAALSKVESEMTSLTLCIVSFIRCQLLLFLHTADLVEMYLFLCQQ